MLPTRLTKVRMVEDVEGIDAQLEVQALSDLRILLCRQINISKARSKDHIAGHIAKAVARVLEAASQWKSAARDTQWTE